MRDRQTKTGATADKVSDATKKPNDLSAMNLAAVRPEKPYMSSRTPTVVASLRLSRSMRRRRNQTPPHTWTSKLKALSVPPLIDPAGLGFRPPRLLDPRFAADDAKLRSAM